MSEDVTYNVYERREYTMSYIGKVTAASDMEARERAVAEYGVPIRVERDTNE